MKSLKREWSQGGSYYNFFKETHGITFKIIDTFSERIASGRHKKLTSDGVVGIILKIQ